MPHGLTFDRAPVTFSAFFEDQLRNWPTLFPAERQYFTRLANLIAQSPPAFWEPLRVVERKMGVNPSNWPRGRFTLQQVDFLNRNPHYAEWRSVVAQLFDRINPMLEEQIAASPQRRLIAVFSPPELPVGPDRLWTRLQDKGRRISLELPAGDITLAEALLRGSGSLLDLCTEQAGPYAAWSVEVHRVLAGCSESSGTVRISYDALEAYRTRLMSEVQRITESEQPRGPRELGERLKQLPIRAEEGEYAKDPVLAEFLRATMLNGNGTLLVNNTFVEWACAQALRRARPLLLAAGFGIRNKVKPFSSLLIYADQDKATPIPTQADVLGSYVDLEVFYQYIWREALKYPEYRGQTAFLFLAEGVDEALVIAPPECPLIQLRNKTKLSTLHSICRDWLKTEG
ncbi:MAG: hypothetical protein ACRD7E_12580 [Bryobacteraceae bacterium]